MMFDEFFPMISIVHYYLTYIAQNRDLLKFVRHLTSTTSLHKSCSKQEEHSCYHSGHYQEDSSGRLFEYPNVFCKRCWFTLWRLQGGLNVMIISW